MADILPPGILITRGDLPRTWVHGQEGEAELQCHCLHEGELGSTWVIRFSKWQGALHAGEEAYEDAYEGNFVFLFVGSHTAALFDTGPVAVSPLRAAVEYIVGSAARGKGLLVAHTHSHGDHVAGDGLWPCGADPAPFRSVTHVGLSRGEAWGFFGVSAGLPAASYPIGEGRSLQLFGIPGHEDAAFAIYDAASHALFTGDNLYPGRLYIRDAGEFAASAARLAQFAATLAHPASLRVLGCHIEMTQQPGVDYPCGTLYQPDEAAYAMGVGDVRELASACAEALRDAELPRIVRARFIVEPK